MVGSVVEKVLCADGYEVVGFDIASGYNIVNYVFLFPQISSDKLRSH